jgi:hypothetical protein
VRERSGGRRPTARRRTEAARALARLARESPGGMALADKLARCYANTLNTNAVSPEARDLHLAAWLALSSLADQAEGLPFVGAARKALGDYEARTEKLHRRLGGLICDRQAQQTEPDWNEYVLRLHTLAHGAGSARGALISGVLATTNGWHRQAFRHLFTALVQGDARKEASDEISRLLQRLIDAHDRQALAAILTDVERMAGQGKPRWQIWAARIHQVIGDGEKAASWYRSVTEGKEAGDAEVEFAKWPG